MNQFEIFLLGKTNSGVHHYSFSIRWIYGLVILLLLSFMALGGVYLWQHQRAAYQQALIEEQETMIVALQNRLDSFADKERRISFLQSYVEELKFVATDSEQSLKRHTQLYQSTVRGFSHLNQYLTQVLNLPPAEEFEDYDDVYQTLAWMDQLQNNFEMLEKTIRQFASQKTVFDEQESTIRQIQAKIAKTEKAFVGHLEFVQNRAKKLNKIFEHFHEVTGVTMKEPALLKSSDFSARGGPSFSDQQSLESGDYGVTPSLYSFLQDTTHQYDLMVDSLDQLSNMLNEYEEAWRRTPTAIPLKRYSISDGYGKRIDPFTHKWDFHAGTDFTAPVGTPIYAPADGKVTRAKEWAGYGLFVEIEHGTGLNYQNNKKRKVRYTTRYGHLSEIKVKRGDMIKRGDLVGLVGSTGRSTGPHLHYEILVNRRHTDPKRIVKHFATDH